ncbi:FkbM family methyltransferase [Streptomyces cacaoi]|uniref:FkbM family methyltransferase n=1 Tax=Streptomyces cacaoi TaxID=1898 RepID=UPI002620CAE1|nr:FkbM family methyltransferase [Streptomyces cacaoi]
MKEQATELLATAARWYVRHGPGRVEKSALSRALNAYLAEHPRQTTATTRTGAAFEVTTEDLIQRYLYMFGTWEPHLTSWLMRRLRPGDGFVDVGANIGYFSVLASKLVGESGRVTAIEAFSDFHQQVLRHAWLNGCTNLRPVHAAVYSRRERLHFTLASRRNLGANSAVPWDGPVETSFEMAARPLSELLSPVEITSARVVKIDVEGAEGSVVRSLAHLLSGMRLDLEIAVEVSRDRMAQIGDHAEDLLNTLERHGFHMYRIPNDYRPEGYAAAIHAPKRPIRWRAPLPNVSDLIFSRIDAEVL